MQIMGEKERTFFIRQHTLFFYVVVTKWYATYKLKSHIRETKHLSTNADSSTDTTVGWTKNTQKTQIY